MNIEIKRSIKNNSTNGSISSFVLECLKPFKLGIIILLITGILWAIELSVTPYITKIIIDKLSYITGENIIKELLKPVLFYFLLLIFIISMFRFNDFIWIKITYPLKRHVGEVVMKKMMEHSLTLFQNHFAGALSNRVREVMAAIPDILKLGINQFFNHSIALVIAVLMLSTINYRFSILLAGWLIIFIIVTVFCSKRAKKLCETVASVRTGVVGQIVDILSNLVSIHLFAAKKIESKQLRKYLDGYVAVEQKRDWWFIFMMSVQSFTFVAYEALSFYLLIIGFKAGIVTAGDFVLVLGINSSIVHILWSLSDDILKGAELIGNINQGLHIALAPIEIEDKPNAKALQVTEGQIIFDKVNFQYKGAAPLFQDKSIIIEPGQKVGLVGYSGGGKTTFVNLILRLYDISDISGARAGAILIDGQDIRDVTQASLRSNIAMIPQDPSLFHRSVMENIRYGLINASDEEVIEAAKRSHAHDFILKLPQQYKALVGERGVKLSGGQRQRIAIARAILKNAPILILDEATSQLDSITENNIQESLWNLMQGKTTLVIAHRLSTLLNMDRILVFERGKIIEDGPHLELLAKEGLYKKLWAAQIGGFLQDER